MPFMRESSLYPQPPKEMGLHLLKMPQQAAEPIVEPQGGQAALLHPARNPRTLQVEAAFSALAQTLARERHLTPQGTADV